MSAESLIKSIDTKALAEDTVQKISPKKLNEALAACGITRLTADKLAAQEIVVAALSPTTMNSVQREALVFLDMVEINAMQMLKQVQDEQAPARSRQLAAAALNQAVQTAATMMAVQLKTAEIHAGRKRNARRKSLEPQLDDEKPVGSQVNVGQMNVIVGEAKPDGKVVDAEIVTQNDINI